MSGQIPPYGKNFRHERADRWHPVYGQALYILKRDEEWFIRAGKGSKQWWLFHGYDRDTATIYGVVQPTLTKAMQLMIDGINGGFYVIKPGVHAPYCKLQGSGLNKYCSCHVGRKAA